MIEPSHGRTSSVRASIVLINSGRAIERTLVFGEEQTDGVKVQVLANVRVLEPTPHQNRRRIDRTSRNNDRLLRSDDRSLASGV